MYVYTIAVLCALAVSSSRATTVNFDDIPGAGIRSVAGDRYKAQGVLLSTNGADVFVTGPATAAHTFPQFVYGSLSDLGSLANADVDIQFVVPGTDTPTVVDYAEFYVVDSDIGVGGTWRAMIYDLASNLLDALQGDSNATTLVSFTHPNIHRFVFSPSPDYEGIDTLSWGRGSRDIPEPATIVMLALAGAGLALRRRLLG